MPRLIHVHQLDPTVLHHPAVVTEFNQRAADVQLRIADRITAPQAGGEAPRERPTS